MPKIEFRDVTAYYENKKDKTISLVLEHFSYTFKNNKITSIVGASGCGKTTLLKCITNSVMYEGNIFIDDENTDTILVKDRNIGYMSQNVDLLTKKTVFDNIIFPLVMKKVPLFDARNKVYELADQFGISFLLARKVKELSMGQQRLVSFIKCLVKDPEIILLDEPTANLDKENSEFLMNSLSNSLKKLNCTIIMVTHSIKEALLFSDEIVVMDDGNIVTSDTPNNIYHSTNNLVQEFFHAEEKISHEK